MGLLNTMGGRSGWTQKIPQHQNDSPLCSIDQGHTFQEPPGTGAGTLAFQGTHIYQPTPNKEERGVCYFRSPSFPTASGSLPLAEGTTITVAAPQHAGRGGWEAARVLYSFQTIPEDKYPYLILTAANLKCSLSAFICTNGDL